MTRTFRLFAALLAVAFCVVFAASASAADAPTPAKAGKRKVSLKIKTDGQRRILKQGVKVRVKANRKRVKLKLTSRTFDDRGYDALAWPTTVKLNKRGRASVTLRLTRSGESQVATCQGRTIRVTGGGAKAKVEMVRDTGACKPRGIDLSRAGECDFIGDQSESLCLLPFPDDYYTVADPGSRTGRLVDLETGGMPANIGAVKIDAQPYNLNDGFSPGQSMVVKVPGLDTPAAFEQTDAVPLDDLGRYSATDAPIVVIDATTGERWPIWVEIDSNAGTPEETALLIHPAENFAAGHRYIVAMRDLRDADGNTLSAPEGFRYYRDDLPSGESAINDQRGRFDSIFDSLRSAGIDRSDLYLAWDFTVASDENIAGRILAMRDDAMAQLGDATMDDLIAQGTAPDFQVDSVDNYTIAQNPDMARRVIGTFTVPCYLAPNCDAGVPGGTFDLNGAGEPVQHGTYTANFRCMIPRSAVDGTPEPARPSLYGHGLLGGAGEVTSDAQSTLGNSHNIVLCATDEIGLSSADIPMALSVLAEMGKFPQIADRLQQGLLNEMYLGRLMISSGGFESDPAFHVDDSLPVGATPYAVDPSRLYYNGNSQGAIEGGALVAVSPDVTRGTLGVGGMNYSVLLNRSVDFDTYAEIGLFPNYPDNLARPLVLSLVQMLWDRGESNGYAHRIGPNPLPDTPPSEVLMNVGFGDHQVSNFTADTMARTIGAGVHSPVVYPGRWPDVDNVWGVPRISDYPYSGSALIYWDSGPIRPNPNPPSGQLGAILGTNPPPIANVPNREGKDPHELPRRTPAEQEMVSSFLRPDPVSEIFDTCQGFCSDYSFSGP